MWLPALLVSLFIWGERLEGSFFLINKETFGSRKSTQVSGLFTPTSLSGTLARSDPGSPGSLSQHCPCTGGPWARLQRPRQPCCLQDLAPHPSLTATAQTSASPPVDSGRGHRFWLCARRTNAYKYFLLCACSLARLSGRFTCTRGAGFFCTRTLTTGFPVVY